MPGLLIGITEPKKKKPLERTGLAPPPFKGSPAPAPEVEAEPDPYDPNESAEPFEAEMESAGSEMDSGAPFSQEQVGYCTPETKCGTCDYFEAPNSCEYVRGTIEADGYCILHSDHGGTGMVEAPAEAEGVDALA